MKLGRHYEINRSGNKIQEGNVYLDWPGTERCDIEYTYYIWAVDGKDIWISIFEGFGYPEDFKCTFVGKPGKLLEKYDKERDLRISKRSISPNEYYSTRRGCSYGR